MPGEEIKKDKMLMIPFNALPNSTHLPAWGVPVIDKVSTASIYYYLLFIYLSADFSSMVLSSRPLNYVSFQPWICPAQLAVEEAASLVCCSHAPSCDAS